MKKEYLTCAKHQKLRFKNEDELRRHVEDEHDSDVEDLLDGYRNEAAERVAEQLSETYFSPTGYLGEAPQLSATYGEYDNGYYVFEKGVSNGYYQNFSGTIKVDPDEEEEEQEPTIDFEKTMREVAAGRQQTLGVERQ